MYFVVKPDVVTDGAAKYRKFYVTNSPPLPCVHIRVKRGGGGV